MLDKIQFVSFAYTNIWRNIEQKSFPYTLIKSQTKDEKLFAIIFSNPLTN